MYRYALSLVKDQDTAHDVVQDCLEKIWKKRSTLEQIHQPEAWAMRITRNQCLDWFKVNRYDLPVNDQMQVSDNRQAGGDVEATDQLQWLEIVLEGFTNKQKEVFQLRDVEGFTYQEIAEILSITVDDVKVTLHRTRKSLKQKMIKINEYGIAN